MIMPAAQTNPNGAVHNQPGLIVVHAMAEYFDVDGVEMHATEFLIHMGLSAHVLVAPDGEVYRCREDNQGAWHAKGFNRNSLGIEFLVKGKMTYAEFIHNIKKPYVGPEQYDAGLDQITQWHKLHDIHTISRHSDLDPARKLDPGDGFPWHTLLSDIKRFATSTDGGASRGTIFE